AAARAGLLPRHRRAAPRLRMERLALADAARRLCLRAVAGARAARRHQLRRQRQAYLLRRRRRDHPRPRRHRAPAARRRPPRRRERPPRAAAPQALGRRPDRRLCLERHSFGRRARDEVAVLRALALMILAGCGLGGGDGGGSANLPVSGAGPYGKLSDPEMTTPLDEPYVLVDPEANVTDPAPVELPDGTIRIFYTRDGSEIWRAGLPGSLAQPAA